MSEDGIHFGEYCVDVAARQETRNLPWMFGYFPQGADKSPQRVSAFCLLSRTPQWRLLLINQDLSRRYEEWWRLGWVVNRTRISQLELPDEELLELSDFCLFYKALNRGLPQSRLPGC